VLLWFRKIAYYEIFYFKINFGKLACEIATDEKSNKKLIYRKN